MKQLFYILILVFIISCEEKALKTELSVKTGDIYTEKFENKELRDRLKEKALYTNVTIAYKELRSIYYLSGNADDFFYNSLIMFNKNHYNPAKEDILFILNGKEDVDVKTKALIDNNF